VTKWRRVVRLMREAGTDALMRANTGADCAWPTRCEHAGPGPPAEGWNPLLRRQKEEERREDRREGQKKRRRNRSDGVVIRLLRLRGTAAQGGLADDAGPLSTPDREAFCRSGYAAAIRGRL